MYDWQDDFDAVANRLEARYPDLYASERVDSYRRGAEITFVGSVPPEAEARSLSFPDTRLTSPVSADVIHQGVSTRSISWSDWQASACFDHCFRTGLPPGRSSVALRQPGSGAQQLPHPGCLAGEVVALRHIGG